MRSIEICSVDDFKTISQKVFKIENLDILIIKEDEEFFAVNNRCPHAGGHLHEGRIERGTITCLNHGACFDYKSGAIRIDMLDEDMLEQIDVNNLPFGKLKTYSLRIENNNIIIEID